METEQWYQSSKTVTATIKLKSLGITSGSKEDVEAVFEGSSVRVLLRGVSLSTIFCSCICHPPSLPPSLPPSSRLTSVAVPSC